jgi:hypothetical protein
VHASCKARAHKRLCRLRPALQGLGRQNFWIVCTCLRAPMACECGVRACRSSELTTCAHMLISMCKEQEQDCIHGQCSSLWRASRFGPHWALTVACVCRTQAPCKERREYSRSHDIVHVGSMLLPALLSSAHTRHPGHGPSFASKSERNKKLANTCTNVFQLWEHVLFHEATLSVLTLDAI